ncbi:MAG: hypothetical protein JXA97_04930 [Anaerolineales bacterium]|nr:hypothetical protein [Anaerolineales bacterium]
MIVTAGMLLILLLLVALYVFQPFYWEKGDGGRHHIDTGPQLTGVDRESELEEAIARKRDELAGRED